ncbi:MAG: hypothetical protein AB7E85_01535 [Pseudobdellovibrionaceae bacterium]
MNKKPFLFDTHIFDRPDPEPTPDDYEAPPPVFSEEELAQAKAQTYKQGKQDGFRESEEGFTQQIHSACGVIKAKLDTLLLNETVRGRHYQEESIALVKAVLEKAYPSMTSRGGLDEVMRAVKDAIEEARADAKLEVTVNTELHAPLETYIASHPGHEGRIVLIADPEMVYGDCAIKWDQGGMVRDMAAFQKTLAKQLDQALAHETVKPQDSEENNY